MLTIKVKPLTNGEFEIQVKPVAAVVRTYTEPHNLKPPMTLHERKVAGLPVPQF
jgi:hypothetical protein